MTDFIRLAHPEIDPDGSRSEPVPAETLDHYKAMGYEVLDPTPVETDPETGSPLSGLSHKELKAYAAQLGVDLTGHLGSKEATLAAIDAAHPTAGADAGNGPDAGSAG